MDFPKAHRNQGATGNPEIGGNVMAEPILVPSRAGDAGTGTSTAKEGGEPHPAD